MFQLFQTISFKILEGIKKTDFFKFFFRFFYPPIQVSIANDGFNTSIYIASCYYLYGNWQAHNKA